MKFKIDTICNSVKNIKYPQIKLVKDMQVFYMENYKTLLREIGKIVNKLRGNYFYMVYKALTITKKIDKLSCNKFYSFYD